MSLLHLILVESFLYMAMQSLKHSLSKPEGTKAWIFMASSMLKKFTVTFYLVYMEKSHISPYGAINMRYFTQDESKLLHSGHVYT